MRLQHFTLTSLLALTGATAASAQTCIHYWDFSTTDDVVGGLATVEVGTPDRSIHPTYGEAYPGSGPSLNNVLDGLTGAGGGFLEAAAFSGMPAALDFGTDSLSFSYWAFDDFAGDQNGRGPRVFDCLSGTTTGLQLGTTNANDWNFRVDDDLGGVVVFNNASPVQLPIDRWVHVACVIDRAASEVRAYADGALLASIPLNSTVNGAPITGGIAATQDLQIGMINFGGTQDQSQNQAIDDLAFYEGALSPADVMALASSAASPLDFTGGIGDFVCLGAPNSTGAVGSLRVTGSLVAASNDLTFDAADLPSNAMSLLVNSSTTAAVVVNPGGSLGSLCVASFEMGRHDVVMASPTGTISYAVDTMMLPTNLGGRAAMVGETWFFQFWHRDMTPAGVNTSNFTGAVSVTFQ